MKQLLYCVKKSLDSVTRGEARTFMAPPYLVAWLLRNVIEVPSPKIIWRDKNWSQVTGVSLNMLSLYRKENLMAGIIETHLALVQHFYGTSINCLIILKYYSSKSKEMCLDEGHCSSFVSPENICPLQWNGVVQTQQSTSDATIITIKCTRKQKIAQIKWFWTIANSSPVRDHCTFGGLISTSIRFQVNCSTTSRRSVICKLALMKGEGIV